MKNVVLACAVLILFASLMGTAAAAERAVSSSTLSSMGFAKAQVMSDQDGLLIRGKGASFGNWGGEGHGRSNNNCHPQPVCHPKHCWTPPSCHTRAH